MMLSVATLEFLYHVYVGLLPPLVTDTVKEACCPTHTCPEWLMLAVTGVGLVADVIVIEAVAELGETQDILEIIVTDTTLFSTS